MPQRIVEVSPGSIGEHAGIRGGDTLLRIDGVPVLDLVDYQFLTARSSLTVELVHSDGTRREVLIHKAAGAPLGLVLESSLMSSPKTCANHCIFCFIEQMPPHMRESLYVRDDDWRLSLMAGNFVTLTNLPEAELQRIIDRKASPIYISVHTTDGALRQRMLNHRHADRILDHLKRFSDNGISFHCQIVLCPGINDGEHLDRTLRDLASFSPHALSAALVPVGLTKYRDHLYPLRPYTRSEAQAVIRQAEAFQQIMLSKAGTRFVFPSDEFYQIAGFPIPPDEAYEEYPQYENGVGLLRRLQDEFEAACSLEAPLQAQRKRRVIVATGTSVAPFMARLLSAHPVEGLCVTVQPIRNRFFGETVTVSGLITGQDLVSQLKGRPADEILITENMLRKGDDVFLDNLSLPEAIEQLGIPIRPVPDDGGALLDALLGKELS
ncbi:MAG: DUF512 domain-containing protein [Clostridia bacterium]|nr:DUF512 domain-containing protein [Clostridia bacterium]